MDLPAAKKRRLAPKVEPTTQAQPVVAAHPPPAFPHDQPPAQYVSVQEPAPQPTERHDFESFARHLQDAAMLIHRQTLKSPYSNVSVLLLRWDEDESSDQDLAALEKVLLERYNYRTDRWNIPTVANPSIKLGVTMAKFLDGVQNARSDQLFIIYYAGYGYVGADNQLYWACNAREESAKLKWDGVRCLFEDAQSDILLLLDTCAVRDAPTAGSHGVKQAIAAHTPDQNSRDPSSRSFTAHLVEALHKLSTGRPFSVQRLYDEVLVQVKQEQARAPSGLTNGASKASTPAERTPFYFTLTPSKGRSLSLAPLPPNNGSPLAAQQSADAEAPRANGQEHAIGPGTVVDLTFDEARVLVCTTFVGDASPDMAYYNQWVHSTPAIASKVAVEGMFLGPPTMLLISMPHSIWNVVQHDKVCCFLGYISSHNMLRLYQRLMGSASPVNTATAKEVEDGRILLEAREAATSTPAAHRHDLPSQDPVPRPRQPLPETPVRLESRVDPMSMSQGSGHGIAVYHGANSALAMNKDDVEDSAEMQKAAEQLKALSHVRHVSDETPPSAHAVRKSPDARQDEAGLSHDVDGEYSYGADYNTPTSRPKQRRSLQKQPTPKQETQCALCSHAPFKDSSSLRKHIAAAHTRPFPCAFSFAGCTSTFGSKNEWKRHIASQHLCLTYYRCSSCPQSTVEGKGNEFNRKDLFTQHLRRMHAPFAIKKAIAKGDSKLQVEWESHVKEMQQSCLVIRRQPPQKSACPKSDCQSKFEGPTAWDEWTEHVGRHMEKGGGTHLGVDRFLAHWALDEGIIERKDDGEYRLTSDFKLMGGNGGDRDGIGTINVAPYVSDDGERKDEDGGTVTVNTGPQVGEKMEVDD